MDVNVRDVDEIVCFGNSLKSFLSDYIAVLNQVSQGSQQDYISACNFMNTIRTYTEAAESDLQAAERRLESTIDNANNNPDEDWSSQIELRERAVEEAALKYERNKQALEEAEGIIRNLKVNIDMVWDQVNRNRSQLQEVGHSALASIQKSVQAIMNYKK